MILYFSVRDFRLTVFLAEDQEENFFVVRSNLHKIDETIILLHAADGDKAITLLKEGNAVPDLFLIDINMPNKNGLELISWIKTEPALKDIPSVAVTASVFAQMKESYVTHGFDHILEKPFTRGELKALLRKVIPA